ncbi:hypothetical protein like AT1G75730 [Hibiscus trionum]|uniref:Uncharacterized protein n=1 Tax=Hibiscus trionum TaxID=183268 RepID=A0A9W7IX52_HIBTR|nr:hypothetical protein like AT1G75730 [Hibiscus trionum]
MDKTRDARRGSRKPQQHSSANLISGFNGGVVDFEKAKKEKIRRLSSVNGTQHSKTETGSFCCCDLSSDNRENQCPSHSQRSSLRTKSTTKRFKIPRKISDECIGVDHASVPRKLRSTMKKRSPEAISPHSPDSKKPKLNLKQGGSDGSRKATVSSTITKDEEEVVETLYALAGMFPDDDSMEVRSSSQPETVEGPATFLEVQKEDTSSVQAAEIVPLSTVNKSSKKACKLDSLNEPSTREQPDLPENKKLHFEPDSTISEMWINTNIPSIKNETDAENTSCIHGDFRVLSEPNLEAGLKQSKLQMTNLFGRTPEMAFGVTDIESQITQRNMTREPRKNGLALWPGLSSTVLRAPQSPSSSQSVANAIPTWLDAANYGPQTCSPEVGSSTEKVWKITRDRNSMKRSTTHVYIARLIHNLQIHDNKDGILQQPLWLKPREGLNQTVLLRNAINGNVAGSNSGSTATDRNSYEARSGIIPQLKMLQQEPQTASASGMNTSKGQSFDFLSLSAGGFGIDANNNSSEVRKAQLQVPHLHLHPQHQSSMPFSISPVDYSSSACIDNLSTATATQQVQLQLPQYLSNPFCGPPYTSQSGVKKQQQRLWAAQYRPHGTSPVMTQLSSRQNGKPESSTSMPYAQTSISPHPTLDAFGPKYYSVSQYQQPKLACTSSLTPTGVRRTDHHFSSVYEESSGGFPAERPLPLQLLRNCRLNASEV